MAGVDKWPRFPQVSTWAEDRSFFNRVPTVDVCYIVENVGENVDCFLRLFVGVDVRCDGLYRLSEGGVALHLFFDFF